MRSVATQLRVFGVNVSRSKGIHIHQKALFTKVNKRKHKGNYSSTNKLADNDHNSWLGNAKIGKKLRGQIGAINAAHVDPNVNPDIQNALADNENTLADNRNTLADNAHVLWLDNAKDSKQLRGGKALNVMRIDPNIHPQIQNEINNTNDAIRIVNVIKNNLGIIEHASIIGKAMKKCNKLRNGNAVHKLMKLLIQSNIKPDVIEFTIFFNSAAQCDSPDLAREYFDIMINKYKIIPNIITFSTLIKSCRRQGKLEFAEWYWNTMINKYQIEPNEFLYTEMISVYAKCHEKHKGAKVFNEYLKKINQGLLPADITTFGSYLSLFSRCADVSGMNDAVNLIHKHRLELNKILVSDLIRGYFTARNHDKCIQELQKWINAGNPPTKPMMMMKCCCLAHIIRCSDEDFEVKKNIYLELKDTLYRQLGVYNLKIDQYIATTQLGGAIFLYRFVNPWEIVKEFRNMLSNNLIGYEYYDSGLDSILIDLHLFLPWQAQFIIRYCIGLELNRLLSKSQNGLCIIVGQRKHVHENTGLSSHGALKQFVINELKSWNPPINCEQDKTNEGRLWIQKTELKLYLNENNYAKQKLTIPSDDWFYEDARAKTK